MRSEVLSRLEALPRLDNRAVLEGRARCRVCGHTATLFDVVDFNKYCDPNDSHSLGWAGMPVPYRRCLVCSYLYTDFFRDWTREEFSRFIYNDDYILVDHEYLSIRPDHVAGDFRDRLEGCEAAKILDYGSGAGVFVERLREYGFEHVVAYDPFSSPSKPDGLFDIVTCFEVIEHEQDPNAILRDMSTYLAPGGCIVFSQTVQPPDILALRGGWWYVAPRNGHVSTFSEESLLRLGRAHGFDLHVGSTVYGFARMEHSIFADLLLGRVGPSLALLRLRAPDLWPDRPIEYGAGEYVLWHPVETHEGWRVRWAGVDTLNWDVKWRPAEMLEIRIPVGRVPSPGTMLDCTITLGHQVRVPTLDRGEWVARFDVAGITHGTIQLRTPPPAMLGTTGPVTIGIRTDEEPVMFLATPGPPPPGADS